MNTGLQDAANLSWKLAAVVRNQSADPEALLDSYQAERHPVGTSVLRSSGALVRLAMARTPLQRTVRALAARALSTLRPISDKAIGMVSGISIAYRAPRGAHPLTAKRAPDLSLREGRLHQLLRDGTFVLVTPPGTAAPASTTPLVHAHWQSDRTTTLLVRPDGYIAWASDHTDPAALRAALTL